MFKFNPITGDFDILTDLASGSETDEGLESQKAVTPKGLDDSKYQKFTVSETEPENPNIGDFWIDIS